MPSRATQVQRDHKTGANLSRGHKNQRGAFAPNNCLWRCFLYTRWFFDWWKRQGSTIVNERTQKVFSYTPSLCKSVPFIYKNVFFVLYDAQRAMAVRRRPTAPVIPGNTRQSMGYGKPRSAFQQAGTNSTQIRCHSKASSTPLATGKSR